jgi:hypothetical protein
MHAPMFQRIPDDVLRCATTICRAPAAFSHFPVRTEPPHCQAVPLMKAGSAQALPPPWVLVRRGASCPAMPAGMPHNN